MATAPAPLRRTFGASVDCAVPSPETVRRLRCAAVAPPPPRVAAVRVPVGVDGAVAVAACADVP
eukprot:4243475-Pleurochrysis_carterae.AAC.1